MRSIWIASALVLGVAASCLGAPVKGDAAAGRDAFSRFGCDSCHSVYREPRAKIPLRNLTEETSNAVTTMIRSRIHPAPDALFDEITMSVAVSQMSDQELSDIVAYLRKPR